MITDQIALAGMRAYLQTAAGSVDLATEASPTTGHSTPLGRGMLLDVNALSLNLRGEDLSALFTRATAPLVSINVRKEMFPGLIRDPYSHRVHRLAGSEDLRRGRGSNVEIMEVDGNATIVSTGDGDCNWTSAQYELPHAIRIDAIAWEFATSRRVSGHQFDYNLWVDVWAENADLNDDPSETILLADESTPADPRHIEFSPALPQRFVAYRIGFKARVFWDSYMRERYSGMNGVSRGTPLLQSVNLLERVDARFTFHSLHELIMEATETRIQSDADGIVYQLIATLPVSALLTERESIALTLHDERISHCSARLDATALLRPLAVADPLQ
jgi:hypothetical protein